MPPELPDTKEAAGDQEWMTRALALAAQGRGLTSPNPMVGAVLVRDGRVVGEGFHTYDGLRHAEIIALEAAGENARGATLYVNLEPCCHTGRTGPCTRALISAGVARVVAAMPDPNPAVSGRGFKELRAAGIRCGLQLHFRFIGASSPPQRSFCLVGSPPSPARHSQDRHDSRWQPGPSEIAQWPSGSLDYFGNFSRRGPTHAPRLGRHHDRNRHDHCRRSAAHRSHRPPQTPGALACDSRLASAAQPRNLRSFAPREAMCSSLRVRVLSSVRAKQLSAAGLEICRVRPRRGRPDLAAVLDELGRREILSVMLEAGPLLNQAALQADLVEKVRLFYAPMLVGLGGSLPGLPSRKRAGSLPIRELSHLRTETFGPDFAVEGYLRDVYRNR